MKQIKQNKLKKQKQDKLKEQKPVYIKSNYGSLTAPEKGVGRGLGSLYGVNGDISLRLKKEMPEMNYQLEKNKLYNKYINFSSVTDLLKLDLEIKRLLPTPSSDQKSVDAWANWIKFMSLYLPEVFSHEMSLSDYLKQMKPADLDSLAKKFENFKKSIAVDVQFSSKDAPSVYKYPPRATTPISVRSGTPVNYPDDTKFERFVGAVYDKLKKIIPATAGVLGLAGTAVMIRKNLIDSGHRF